MGLNFENGKAFKHILTTPNRYACFFVNWLMTIRKFVSASSLSLFPHTVSHNPALHPDCHLTKLAAAAAVARSGLPPTFRWPVVTLDKFEALLLEVMVA